MDKKDIVAEKERLANQCDRILERLRQGAVSNHELAKIALKYSSRISDLRRKGYVIRVCSRDWKSGVAHYELVEEQQELFGEVS